MTRPLPFATGLLLLAVALPVPAAKAASASIRVPMRIVGFDQDVARRHGYRIVHLPDGRQASVPMEAPSRAAQPFDTVEGDCGFSYVELDPEGVGYYRVRTGFHVNDWATEYHWKVNVTGPGVNRHHTWGGPLRARRDWRGSRRGDIKSEGDHDATVVPPESYAVLWNGGVCYSGGPRDRKYLL